MAAGEEIAADGRWQSAGRGRMNVTSPANLAGGRERISMADQTYRPTEGLIGNAVIKVIGCGGGGSNAVSRMYRDRIPEVEYISINIFITIPFKQVWFY